MTTDDADEQRFEEDAPTETPFDPKEGIWFKYGRIYMDRENQLSDFQKILGITLPEDFLALIGEYCQGGFDGWYEVKKGVFGSMVWNHLLLMKLPDSVDEEGEEAPHMRGKTFIATRLLERKEELFYSDAGVLRYFPFGAAICFQPTKSAIEGYLAFDFENRGRVVFLCEDRSEAIDVAESFSRMMRGSVFQFYG